jgi:hypothetical protein
VPGKQLQTKQAESALTDGTSFAVIESLPSYPLPSSAFPQIDSLASPRPKPDLNAITEVNAFSFKRMRILHFRLELKSLTNISGSLEYATFSNCKIPT